MDAPRTEHKEVRPLSPADARRLLAAARGHRLEALYTVALALGLRQGEALGLRWSDVDLDGGTLAVRRTLSRMRRALRGDKPRFSLAEPKTTRSRRTMLLPAVVAGALREHRKRQLAERLLAGSRWRDADFVFTTTIGTPLDGRNVTQGSQRLLAEAGMPRLRFHDLRHSCATLLLAQGVPARVVMELLGHSDIGTTLGIYSRVVPALQREAADRVDAALV